MRKNSSRVSAGQRDWGFALLLKFFAYFGRFPRGRAELPDEVVEHIARQVKVSPGELGLYEWTGSTIEYHRNQIRKHLGFRACGVADADKLTDWLAVNVAHAERQPERVREELLKRCRAERIEPPSAGRIARVVRSALHNAEETWFAQIAARLDAETMIRVLTLVDVAVPAEETEDADADQEEREASVLALIKARTGNVSLESMLTEISKLTAIRAIGLPAGLFADVAPKVLASWRSRAAVESPSHLRRRARSSTAAAVTLLAALLVEREREVTDNLVDLLIATVHRIGARAERKVTEELINAFKRVWGKENILFTIADASLAAPDGTVRQVVFPAVRARDSRSYGQPPTGPGAASRGWMIS